jgi:hypothetical protein
VAWAVVASPVPKGEGPFGFAQGRLGGTLKVVWRGHWDRGHAPPAGSAPEWASD